MQLNTTISHSLFSGTFLLQSIYKYIWKNGSININLGSLGYEVNVKKFLWNSVQFSSVQFSSVSQLCPTLCNPLNYSTPSLPVHHQLSEFTQTYVHRVGDTIQSSHPLSSPSSPAPNPSQHQGLFQWVSSSHQVANVLEFQLQHQSFQWTPRTDLL